MFVNPSGIHTSAGIAADTTGVGWAGQAGGGVCGAARTPISAASAMATVKQGSREAGKLGSKILLPRSPASPLPRFMFFMVSKVKIPADYKGLDVAGV